LKQILLKDPEENPKIIEELKYCENPDEIAQNTCVEQIKEKHIQKYLENEANFISFLAEER
jgi:hypothetical protein